MINNKKIVITKNNQFDKGWTLFEPFDIGLMVNRSYRDFKLNDVVKAITYSNVVNIILCEVCLSSRIVSELEWANQYIKINIIVKDKNILSAYPKLTFNSVAVDQTIDFNYIGITGKETVRVMFKDSFNEIDDTIDNIYFNQIKGNTSYSFLETIKTVILTDNDGEIDYSSLIREAQKRKCKIYYIVSNKAYNRKIFEFARNKNLTLLVSDYVGGGVICVNEYNELFGLNVLKNEVYISHSLKDTFAYFGKQFRCCFFEDTIDSSKLVGEYITCYSGEIKKLKIAKTHIVEIDVPLALMEDFINEEFDSSICEKHNDYSAIAENVEYRFTLIPPIFDETYVESHLYDGIHQLLKKWNALQKIDFDAIKSEYQQFMKKDYGLILLIDKTKDFNLTISNIVKSIDYNAYYDILRQHRTLVSETYEKIIDVLISMFNEIYQASSSTKFDKFDVEIEGYRATILEKQALVEQGIEVLSNKRRIEILTKKISDLLELKKRFEGSSGSTTDKKQTQFVERCKAIMLNAPTASIIGESIENIVKAKEESRETKLEAFTTRYLYAINLYMENCLKILDALLLEHIPEKYSVYEKDNQRYIVIESVKEFDTTQALCKEFNLLCLTRR